MPEYRAKVKNQVNGRLYQAGEAARFEAPPSHHWERIDGPEHQVSPELVKRPRPPQTRRQQTIQTRAEAGPEEERPKSGPKPRGKLKAPFKKGASEKPTT